MLGLAPRIVDLVSSGRTLKENGLVEVEVIAEVTCRLIVNRAAMKTRAEVVPLVEAFRRAVAIGTLRSEAGEWAHDRALAERLDAIDESPPRPGFDASSPRSSTPAAKPTPMSRATSRTIIARVRDEGDAAVARLHAASSTATISTRPAGGSTAPPAPPPSTALDPDAARRARTRRRPASAPITRSSARPTATTPTRPASASARAGARSMRRGSTSPAAARPIPSSVLMNAIPAKVAGVERLVMVTPDARRRDQPARPRRRAPRRRRRDLAHRRRAGDRRARLWHRPDRAGRRRHRPRQRLGRRGQAPALRRRRHRHGRRARARSSSSPTAENDPDWIAADLLSQAEHDPTSQSILFTDDAAFADAVAEAVERQIGDLPTAEAARAAWDANGAIIVVADAGRCDPAGRPPRPRTSRARRRRSAGAVRPGPPRRHRSSSAATRPRRSAITSPARTTSSPPAAARAFRSGLSVLDFMKRTSFLRSMRPRWPRSAPPRWRSPMPRGCPRTRGRWPCASADRRRDRIGAAVHVTPHRQPASKPAPPRGSPPSRRSISTNGGHAAHAAAPRIPPPPARRDDRGRRICRGRGRFLRRRREGRAAARATRSTRRSPASSPPAGRSRGSTSR